MDDARQRRVAPQRRRDDLERAVPVDRSGEHLVAVPLVDRQRLAGDRRLVDVAFAGHDTAVERQLLAGPARARDRQSARRRPARAAPGRRARRWPRAATDPSARGWRDARGPCCAIRDTARARRERRRVAPSSHSPIAMAPTTATVISTCMSNVRRRIALHARRTDGTPPETIVSSAATCAMGVAPAAWAARLAASDTPLTASSHRRRSPVPVPRGSSCSSHARMPVSATAPTMAPVDSRAASYCTRSRPATTSALKVSRPARCLNRRSMQRHFLVAVEALDLEDRFGVDLAHRAGGGGCAHGQRSRRVPASLTWSRP